MCVITLFAAFQMIFLFNYLLIVLKSDEAFTHIIIDRAVENGYVHHAENDTFVPEMTNALYLQRDNFFDPPGGVKDGGGLLIPVFVFYTCSLLWVLSYVQLLTTDITSHFYEEDDEEAQVNI